jgi:hypothetical protein
LYANALRSSSSTTQQKELDEVRLLVESGLELHPGEPVYDASYWACSGEIAEDVGRCAAYAANRSVVQVEQGASDSPARCEAVAARERSTQARMLYTIAGGEPA